MKNECSRTGCKNERLISPMKQKLSDTWLKSALELPLVISLAMA